MHRSRASRMPRPCRTRPRPLVAVSCFRDAFRRNAVFSLGVLVIDPGKVSARTAISLWSPTRGRASPRGATLRLAGNLSPGQAIFRSYRGRSSCPWASPSRSEIGVRGDVINTVRGYGAGSSSGLVDLFSTVTFPARAPGCSISQTPSPSIRPMRGFRTTRGLALSSSRSPNRVRSRYSRSASPGRRYCPCPGRSEQAARCRSALQLYGTEARVRTVPLCSRRVSPMRRTQRSSLRPARVKIFARLGSM